MLLSRRAILGAGASLPFVRLTSAAAEGSDTLRFGLSAFPASLEPFLNNGTSPATMRLMMHRGLFGYGPDSNLRGELAEHWENDGSTGWTIKLREAYWHDGSPVTADDVRYTIETVGAEKSTAYLRAQMQEIVKIDAPDPRTIKLTTRTPTVTLPLWFASYYLPIIGKGSWKANQPGKGAGPFVLGEVERGQSIAFTAFDKFYRKGLPKVRNVKFIAYPDENLRVAALQAGDVDIIDYVPWQSMEAIEKDAKLKLATTDGPFMFLQFNFDKKPFDDPRVRLAVAHAIRREDIVKAAFFGRGTAIEGFATPENSPYYEPSLAHIWNYDPAKAKELLAAAGVGSGFQCTLLSTAQYGMHKNTAEVVQQHLAAIGIQCELALPDWATRITLGNKGQYDIAVQGSAWENVDPDGWGQLIDGTLAQSAARSYGIKIPELQPLMEKGRAEFDVEKRKKIYTEVQKICLEKCPYVSLTWRSQGYAMKKEVQGFTNIPGPITFYSGTTLEETLV
jgi:peptide/nickel transport system substrate-binding protein